jgi:hypothetical protein
MSNEKQNEQIYNNPIWYPDPSGNCTFQAGDYVYAIRNGTDYFSRALIITVNENGTYEIQFDDGVLQEATLAELQRYFPCDCNKLTFNTNAVILNALANGPECIFPLESLLPVHVL